MEILITGSHGLIGAALCASLAGSGHAVTRLVRRPPSKSDELNWDAVGSGSATRSGEFDVVFHLAGENIAAGRWTPARKKHIYESRVKSTLRLAGKLAGLPRQPEVFVVASAVGYYGDRGEEILDETSSPGQGFLAEVCRAWEKAAEPAAEKGIRVVHARFGMILDKNSGALGKMLPPFRLGAGGRIGSGSQYMSWIALEDAVRALAFVMENKSVKGPVNVTSPNPVTNREFTMTLGRVLHRPAVFALPAFAVRLAFGEMADALLLASERAVPKKLTDSGFQFLYPWLEPALRKILK
jgi:uncharacterized protein (TIGR01777 family)